jgi:hypothetical protein
MRRLAFLSVLILAVGGGGPLAQDRQNLNRVTIPDENGPALKVLKNWLEARGFEIEARKDLLLMRRGGVLMNLIPIVTKGELDRIRVLALYSPKADYKGSKEFEELAVKINRSQNFMQVYVDGEGNLAASGNLTFYDELTARLFDAYVDAFAQIVKKYLLIEEALTLLK